MWHNRVCALEAAEQVMHSALNDLDAAKTQLAVAEIARIRHDQTQPEKGKDDVAYEPWRWTAQELGTKVQVEAAKVSVAKADADMGKGAVMQLDMGSLGEATARLDDLINKMKEAEEAARRRRASVDVNMEAFRMKAEDDRAAL